MGLGQGWRNATSAAQLPFQGVGDAAKSLWGGIQSGLQKAGQWGANRMAQNRRATAIQQIGKEIELLKGDLSALGYKQPDIVKVLAMINHAVNHAKKYYAQKGENWATAGQTQSAAPTTQTSTAWNKPNWLVGNQGAAPTALPPRGGEAPTPAIIQNQGTLPGPTGATVNPYLTYGSGQGPRGLPEPYQPTTDPEEIARFKKAGRLGLSHKINIGNPLTESYFKK
jgi:hypothetical protein